MSSLAKSRVFLSSPSFQKPMTSLFARSHQRAQLLSPILSKSSSLHTSPPRSALKEEDRDRENVGAEIEQHKQELLRKQKEGKASWSSNLASSSEADVKADRGEIDGAEEKEMQDVMKKGKHGSGAEKKC